jgi:hypothetical protein
LGQPSEELFCGCELCESVFDCGVVAPGDLGVVICDGHDAFTAEDVLAEGVEAVGAACHGPGLVDEAGCGGGVEQWAGDGTGGWLVAVSYARCLTCWWI